MMTAMEFDEAFRRLAGTVRKKLERASGCHDFDHTLRVLRNAELLAEELALRDLDGQPLTRENYDALMARIDAYLSEFDEHGTDRVTVDLDEG